MSTSLLTIYVHFLGLEGGERKFVCFFSGTRDLLISKLSK